ncbi:MAG: glycosyltransferase family 4 protein, partial [Pseudomonadota bacterium]
ARIPRICFRVYWFLLFGYHLLRRRYALVHIHAAGSAFFRNAVYALIARLCLTKVLFHLHGTDWDSFYADVSPMRKSLIEAGLASANRIVVLYSRWAEEIRRLGTGTEVTVVRNFVHDSSLDDSSLVEAERRDLGLGPEDFVTLMVGSVGFRKGVFDILKAVPIAASRDSGVCFVLAGGEEEPGEMAQIKSIIKTEKLDRWVRVLGEVERARVPGLLGLAGAFALPSYQEGMPISIIEALRAGVPVISSPVGGIPDMIEDGVSGILIPPGRPDLIAEAVLSLKHNAGLRAALAQGGRRAFEDKFEFSKGIDVLRGLYLSLC